MAIAADYQPLDGGERRDPTGLVGADHAAAGEEAGGAGADRGRAGGAAGGAGVGRADARLLAAELPPRTSQEIKPRAIPGRFTL